MADRKATQTHLLSVRTEVWICLLLAAVLLIVYSRVGHFEYIGFDDALYVADNPYVNRGVTLEGAAWAFRFLDRDFSTYWHPLTWLSHMLDVQVFGMNPGRHHFVNLVFHIINCLLLFWVLTRMTGDIWPSALVAALFALHPLNVETVAWVSNRKNLLSTLLWMLTLLSYSYYARRPIFSRYLLTIFIFMLGLMAKPMLVTLPCVLLLLDYWPLGRLKFDMAAGSANGVATGRMGKGGGRAAVMRPVLEKVPFFALSVVSVYLSTSALQNFNTVVSTEMVPLSLRIANALVSYLKYIFKMIWPVNLSIFYPYPKGIPFWQAAGAAVVLLIISIATLRLSKSRPYLLTGWLWFLGTLVPAIGLVQAGLWPQMADRWAYVPLVGLFIMAAWSLADALPRRTYPRGGLLAGSMALLMLLALTARGQVAYWQNSVTLFERAIEIDGRNMAAHIMLAKAQEESGRTAEALHCYAEILKIDPAYFDAHNHLGLLLAEQGKTEAAMAHFRQAIAINPADPAAYFNLGNALSAQGNYADAIRHYNEAIRLNPGFVKAYNNLGLILVSQGRVNEAIRLYAAALEIEPDDENIQANLKQLLAARKKEADTLDKLLAGIRARPQAHQLNYEIGNIFRRRQSWAKAIQHYQKALSIKPDFMEARIALGLVYSLKGDYRAARSVFQQAGALQPRDWRPYYYMAGILARQNQSAEAIAWLDKAIRRGLDNWELIKSDPNLAGIRGTPYYQNLINGR